MGGKRAAVYWLLPPAIRDLALTELCPMVGASELAVGLRPGECDCRWSGMRCIARRRESAGAELLELQFWQSEVLQQLTLGGVSLEEDPLLPMAHSFRDACERLAVDAAFIRVRLSHREPALLETFVRDVAVADINALCDELHAALFVADGLGDFPFERLVERECLDTPSGMILFAGRDEGRWY